MRKFLCVLLSTAIFLSGYALSDTQTATATVAGVKKAKKCLFPHSRKRAPNWICNPSTDGWAITAVGSSAKTAAGTAFMEQMAAADARVQLARNLRDSMQKKIAGSKDNTADQDGALITRITDESLQETRIIKNAYGPDGTLYVLVGLDEASAQKLRESIAADYLERQRK